ncbi:T9SS C-terminal target domain-containing protein [Lacihabitans sp. LS3-19]|uniref:M14 family zinc carboxypeptidase n=1 Tax=Lacihabitans sp. LS3-19 TaxID=2487335 RepID=UPI0020CDC477|nr:M14 family zinc carboxypeptidase [Lacihabitans sp. LS3-19]MCP9769032.1 T9SS C-terminal target domain-containing protein [Lacihabitans sp. LS3-19]
MKKNLLLILIFSMIFSVSQAQKYHRINSKITNKQIEDLFSKGLEADHFHLENGAFTAELSDNDISLLKKNGIKFKYLIKDLEKNIPKINAEIDKKASRNLRTAATPSNFNLGSYGGFYTMTELHNILDQMRILYPNLISAKTSIGTTIEGRPIYMVKISDNADIDEPESELFLNAVHHAREPMSLSQLVYFMWHVLENYGTDQDITTMLNSTEMYIVPMVNPDGYQTNLNTNPNGGGMWRKNRRNNGDGTLGVDINRNYGYLWGYNNTGSSPTTSSQTYRGTSAFSEPETQTIRDFCNSHDFVASMDFHSYGNYCIYPYSHIATNSNPELPLFQQMGGYLTAENGFTHGNAQQTVNYTSNGGGDDWKYGEQTTKNKIYSFTPEVGASTDGFYPAQSRIIPLCESTLQMNRKILKLSSKFAELTTPAPATISTLNGVIPFNVINSSLRNPSYSVSIGSTNPYVLPLSGSQSFNNMNLFQNSSGALAFNLSPSTPIGTSIDFTLTLDNGHSPVTKTVTIIYDCATPSNLQTTSLTTNSANTSWSSVPGAGSYLLSHKAASSGTWSGEISVTGTTFNISNLVPGTAYDWRVRTDICNSFSSGSFSTVLPCDSPGTIAIGNITSNSGLLSWSAVVSATNYQVQYKLATSSTWITATNTNNSTSYSLAGLAANSLYDVRVRTNCTTGNSTYTNNQFTTAIPTINYCTSKGNNVSFFWIDYFKLGTITRTSGADAGYYNGTATMTNLTRGTSNTVTFSPGYTSSLYRVYWRAWIDYNQDGDFLDSGEQIVGQSTTGIGNYNKTFTIPQTARLGETRIRISMKYGSYPTSCETFTYGEVEDYTVNIVSATANIQDLAGAKISTSTDKEVDVTNLQAIIFPNPTSSELFIDFKGQSSKNSLITITDTKGNEKFKTLLKDDYSGYGIDVANYSPALYLVIIEADGKRKTLKFVKE